MPDMPPTFRPPRPADRQPNHSDKAISDRRHDARRRQAKPWRAWYKRPAWKRARLAQLASQPLCELHLETGDPVTATVVNHRIPHRGDWSLFIDGGNHQSLCKKCHDGIVQAAEAAIYRKKQPFSIPRGVQPSAIPVTLVCGPPAAGRSMFVNAHAGPHDIVIDLDECFEVNGDQAWSDDQAATRRAFELRDEMILDLATPVGRRDRRRAWLVVGAPTLAEREAWIAALEKVTVHMVVVRRAVCLERIAADPKLAAVRQRIEAALGNWFAQYEPAP